MASRTSQGLPAGPYRRRFLPSWILKPARHLRHRRSLGPRLGSYTPRSMVVRPNQTPASACVPVVDVHTHLGRWLTPDGGWMEDPLNLLDLMEECNVRAMVNLDGRWGLELEENLDRYDRACPGRFMTFCHVDWSLLDRDGGPDELVRSLERSAAAGARGLKVWKDLGLTVRWRGRVISPDEPALSILWAAAGELGLPVLVHVADPLAYFTPTDRCNERLEDLLRNPGNSQASLGTAGFDRLLDAFENLVASHPATTFVGAHVGGYAENLAWVSRMLDQYPNLWVDVAGRAAEIGRQPRAAAALIERHSERVLFGSDSFPIQAAAYRLWFRLLETADEAFDYSDQPVPPTGRWPVYGLALEPAVLERVYASNAVRLLRTSSPGPSVPQGSVTAQPPVQLLSVADREESI